jgi:hypothetical protein
VSRGGRLTSSADVRFSRTQPAEVGSPARVDQEAAARGRCCPRVLLRVVTAGECLGPTGGGLMVTQTLDLVTEVEYAIPIRGS